MTSQSTALTAAADWARFFTVLASRAYRTMLVTLSVIAIAPILFGLNSFVIKSGSMEPSINVGDVAVARPFEVGEKVEVGRVYVFDDPGTSQEHRLTHRIVALNDDGTYTSAGDANEVTDATPVTTGDMEARAIILAPYVGLPVTWIQAGEWAKLALWLMLTIAAFVTATRNLPGEPPKWGLLRLFLDWRRERRAGDGAASDPEPADSVLVRRRSKVPVVLGAVLALLGTGVSTTNAAFTAQSRNSGSTWTAGAWSQPYVSAVLADAPSMFWLLDEAAGAPTAQDRSGNTVLGTYKPGVTLGQPGALTERNTGTSMRTAGGVALTSANPVGAPGSHSVELWFRTTSSSGGYLVGFGDQNGAVANTEDRILRMTGTGQLSYGDWDNNPVRSIITPGAYNDGAWHQVVVASTKSNFSDTTIYVDGAPAVTGSTSKTGTYTGYVRLGGGTGSPAFNGLIDNVSVYGAVLPASRVAAHYAAR